ncbi:hypothetical protein Droror1_Dr00004378 [Drosera rotundifolia]
MKIWYILNKYLSCCCVFVTSLLLCFLCYSLVLLNSFVEHLFCGCLIFFYALHFIFLCDTRQQAPWVWKIIVKLCDLALQHLFSPGIMDSSALNLYTCYT